MRRLATVPPATAADAVSDGRRRMPSPVRRGPRYASSHFDFCLKASGPIEEKRATTSDLFFSPHTLKIVCWRHTYILVPQQLTYVDACDYLVETCVK